MNKSLLLLFVMALLLPLQAHADEIVSLKVGYQKLSPTGNFTGSENGIGTSVDIEDDLNLDDSEEVTAEAALHLGSFRLSAGYMPLKFSGTGTLTQNFFFNGAPAIRSRAISTSISTTSASPGICSISTTFRSVCNSAQKLRSRSSTATCQLKAAPLESGKTFPGRQRLRPSVPGPASASPTSSAWLAGSVTSNTTTTASSTLTARSNSPPSLWSASTAATVTSTSILTNQISSSTPPSKDPTPVPSYDSKVQH